MSQDLTIARDIEDHQNKIEQIIKKNKIMQEQRMSLPAVNVSNNPLKISSINANKPIVYSTLRK